MRAFAVFFIVCVLGVVFFPFTSVVAEPSSLSHEDPAAAESSVDVYSFLSSYSQVFGLMSSGDYVNATALLERLRGISFPDDLCYIIDKYNGITQELIDVLNVLESQLSNASALLDQYRLDEAGKVLNDAGVLVTRADILLGDLRDATQTLSAQIGVFSASVEERVKVAYSQLQSILQRLKDLVDRYHELMSSLRDDVLGFEELSLKPTEFSLGLNSTSVFVGGAVKVSGTLSSDSVFLSNRIVSILLDGVKVDTALVLDDGTFAYTLSIPYTYVRSMRVEALYAPTGADKGVYLASKSSAAFLDVKFFDTLLSSFVPLSFYLGLPLNVSGLVTSSDNMALSQRVVNFALDGVVLDEAETGVDGYFSLHPLVSSQFGLGTHNVSMVVKPKGVYAGVSNSVSVNVSQILSVLNVKVPFLVVLPAGVFVEGSVSSDDSFGRAPVSFANVTLGLSSISANVQTDINGEFNATLDLPLNLVLVGSQKLRIQVDPFESWQGSVKTSHNIFVVNCVNLGLALGAFAFVGFVSYSKLLKSNPKRKDDKILLEESTIFSPVRSIFVVPSRKGLRVEGTRAKILKSYVDVSRLVSHVTGVSSEAHTTLREFLLLTESELKEAYGLFSDLTLLAESALYSCSEPGDDKVALAFKLKGKLEGVL